MAFVDWSAGGCEVTKTPSGVTSDVPTFACIIPVIASIVQIVLFFLGSTALLVLIWGVIKFALSQGDPKAVQSAKNTMTYAVFGVIFIFITFMIMNFLNDFLGLPKGTLLKFGFSTGP